jgi:hypothetical protein
VISNVSTGSKNRCPPPASRSEKTAVVGSILGAAFRQRTDANVVKQLTRQAGNR